MKVFTGRRVALLAALSCGAYLGYRIYESHRDEAALRKRTAEEAVATVAIVRPRPVPPSESITLPGNLVGWYEAPIYARVTGYVKMWYADYGAAVKSGDVLAEIN